ncbi:MAG: hypothetical protein K6B69_11630 [Lachnospiraceae bacterium]|nr:hypothetical protein [Lachnospiraceae bacterium]
MIRNLKCERIVYGIKNERIDLADEIYDIRSLAGGDTYYSLTMKKID